MSGFFRPAAAKMSITSSDATARETICRMAWSSSSSLLRSPDALLARTARTAWKKPTSSRIASASSCGTASANALRQLGDGLEQPRSCRPPARGCAPGRRAADRQPLRRRAGRPARPVEAVEEAAADLVLLQHHGDGLLLVDRRLSCAAALGVGRQRLLQLVREAQVIDDQPARLVLEDAVHARNGLHQPVAAHRLVHVHRVQARRVEAGQPHVAHDDDLERVVRVPEPLRQRLAPRLVADVRLPRERVGRRAGHHDLDDALARRPRCATRAAAARCSSYRSTQMRRLMQTTIALPSIASSRFSKCSTRSCAISSSRFSAPTTASSCGPLGLELLLALDLLAFGGLLELRIELRPLAIR